MKRCWNDSASYCASNGTKRPRLDCFTSAWSSSSSEYSLTERSSLESEPSTSDFLYTADRVSSSEWSWLNGDSTDSDSNDSDNLPTNSFDVEEVPYSSRIQESLGPMVWKYYLESQCNLLMTLSSCKTS